MKAAARWLRTWVVVGGLFPAVLRAASPGENSIQAAAAYSAAERGTALLIQRGGKTIFETYANGSHRSKAMKIYSGTKGFWNLAALAAQEDGLLDLDERVGASLAEWQSDRQKAKITARQLLSFSAGLAEANGLHGNHWKDRNIHALKQGIVGTPGAAFTYGPASLQVVDEVLKRKLAPRDESPTRYLERRVLRPMGLGKQRYLADAEGNPLLATGFMLTAREWSRMGGVILRDGAPILRSSMSEAFRGSDANPMFGLGFWNNRLAERNGAREIDPEELLDLKWYQQNWRDGCLSRVAPPDLVASIGSGGQRLYVVPSLELVIVRQGSISKFSDRRFLRLLFRGE